MIKYIIFLVGKDIEYKVEEYSKNGGRIRFKYLGMLFNFPEQHCCIITL